MGFMSNTESNLQTARRRQVEAGAQNTEKVEQKVSEQSALNIADESKPVEVGQVFSVLSIKQL